jgi:tRNA pseudouridine(55) synthase
MIIPLYQPLGTSSHQLAQRLGQLIKQPTTHTGTLDPMAEGVLVCLTGEDRFNKEQHATVTKEYLFSILVGFSTDSHDLLGIITEKKPIKLSTIDQNILNKLVGNYEQIIPTFSAKRVEGQSFFDFAKDNKVLPKKVQSIEVKSLVLIKKHIVSGAELLQHIEDTIPQIEGNFRQNDILVQWQQQLLTSHDTTNYSLLTFKTITSKRTYIRGMVRDLSQLIGIPMTTFHIKRTRNGAYHIKDCICLV